MTEAQGKWLLLKSDTTVNYTKHDLVAKFKNKYTSQYKPKF